MYQTGAAVIWLNFYSDIRVTYGTAVYFIWHVSIIVATSIATINTVYQIGVDFVWYSEAGLMRVKD